MTDAEKVKFNDFCRREIAGMATNAATALAYDVSTNSCHDQQCFRRLLLQVIVLMVLSEKISEGTLLEVMDEFDSELVKARASIPKSIEDYLSSLLSLRTSLKLIHCSA